MTCSLFAGILANQLLRNAYKIKRNSASSNIRTIDISHSEDDPVFDLSYTSGPVAKVQYYGLAVNSKV